MSQTSPQTDPDTKSEDAKASKAKTSDPSSGMLLFPRIELLAAADEKFDEGTVYLAPDGRLLARREAWWKFAPLLVCQGTHVGMGDGWCAVLGTFLGIAHYKVTKHQKEQPVKDKSDPPRPPKVWYTAEETIEEAKPIDAWIFVDEQNLEQVGTVLDSALNGGVPRPGRNARPRKMLTPLWMQQWAWRSIRVNRRGEIAPELRCEAKGETTMPQDVAQSRMAKNRQLTRALDEKRLGVALGEPREITESAGSGRRPGDAVRASELQ